MYGKMPPLQGLISFPNYNPSVDTLGLVISPRWGLLPLFGGMFIPPLQKCLWVRLAAFADGNTRRGFYRDEKHPDKRINGFTVKPQRGGII